MTYYIDYDNLRYFHVTHNNGSGLNYCDEYTVNDNGRLEVVVRDVMLTNDELGRLKREEV